MASLSPAAANPAIDPAIVAAAWFAHFAVASLAAMPREEALPAEPLAVLAAFAAIALAEGRTLVILAPDDQQLPEISNALDLSIRPLCLVLPGADFAARIALRATLSLMKSRLARESEDEQTAAWRRQRERIAQNQALWHEAHQWVARNDRSDWPERVADLFPARILPIAAYRSLRQKNADITLLYRCDAPPELVAPPGSLLHVGARASSTRSGWVAVADADLHLRMELAQLTQDVAELELELATAQAEVGEFTRRYYELVGRRMVELDALQARLAREHAERSPEDPRICAEAKEKQETAEQSARENERFTQASADEPAAFRPSNDVKRLFRQIAQKIHPDRAIDEADRAWRTHLMSAANRAYRAGDETALQEVAALWQEGKEGRHGSATDGPTGNDAAVVPAPTLVRQVENMRARLLAIERELQKLFGSRLYELFIAARQARRQGRDLLAEMAEKLDETIKQLGEQTAVG
jgi:primosomal protein N'